MLNQSCYSFVEALASKAPTPGGGGAAAYAASIGVALGSMVGNLTLGKKKYADVQEDIEAMLIRSQDLMERFNALVDADAKAFLPLAKAYGMPVETAQQKEEKEAALQKALVGAARVPLDIAAACLEAIQLHGEYAEKGSLLVISDAGCGVILCKAALQSARLNVLINLKLMKDEALKAEIRESLESITEKGTTLADEIYALVEDKL